MFQLMLAHAIAAERADVRITGYTLPMWDLAVADGNFSPALTIQLRHHTLPFAEILDLVRRIKTLEVSLMFSSQRYCYYRRHIELYREIFPLRETAISTGPGELLISIRLAEVLQGQHKNYFPLPLSFYETIVGETGLAPVFMGQLGDDIYSDALRSRFPGARFVPSAGAAADFDFIRRAVNIMPSISTFSWLAAWLSERAERIVLPVTGLFHPGYRTDIDLLPLDDPRYQFYAADLGRWWGKPSENLQTLIDNRCHIKRVTPASLQQRYPRLGRDGTPRFSRPIETTGLAGQRYRAQVAAETFAKSAFTQMRPALKRYLPRAIVTVLRRFLPRA